MLGERVLITLLASLCLCCSCSEFDASSREDYIGPKVSEPNTVSTAVTEVNTVNAAAPAAASQAAGGGGPLRMTIGQAMLSALENNKSLVVQRFNPQIERTFEQQERAAFFEPVLTGELAKEKSKITTGPTNSEINGTSVSVGVQGLLPTGTTLGLTGTTAPVALADNDEYASRIAFSATQSLLRGLGSAINLASVNQARIDVKISQYELRGFVQSLVAQVEETYWDYALAERRIEIFNQSLELAEKQLQETRERINLGDLAPSELPAAEAEVAVRREDLINARSTLAKTRLSLLRLINPPGGKLWNKEIALTSQPISPSITLDDVESHVALALRMRPDLNQARLLRQRDELEVVKTKNGLLPKLDLFVTLGKSGYADSFGGSIKNIDDDNYDAIIGLAFEYPPSNRAAEARHLRAVLTRQQAGEAIDNLSQLIEVDVRSAYLEIARSQEQVVATAATSKLQEEKLRSETEKFRNGKSTSLLVAQAQRDFVASQISQVQAVVNYLKSLVEIYRLEGSLLERRGIAGPGGEPVRSSDTPLPATD
jgi:outer membrane protein TolC